MARKPQTTVGDCLAVAACAAALVGLPVAACLPKPYSDNLAFVSMVIMVIATGAFLVIEGE